ncbi:MAG TPA: sigma-70 family RNA polymerase sigma factor [Kofleriaceae bacterium]|nr:sigma-70 family RNA polymerase sigma factor [Kofleriaceae bacterium]
MDDRCEHACFVAWVTRLVRAERPALVAIARGEGLADAEALDAVQDGLVTFLGLPEASALVDRDPDGARLLAAVVRNAARNARRRHHRARPHDGDPEALAAHDDAAARVAAAEQRLAMSACVAQLGAGAQRVVMMRLLDELSGEEVAAELGTTVGNVAVMLHRARERLRACLAAAEVTPR